MSVKAYLYCTNAKPWLCINSGTFFGSNNPYELAGAREKLSVHLNGTVCFECEIEKAEKIVIAPFPFANGDYQYGTKTLTPDALEARSCLSVKELNDYDPRHLCNIANGLKDIEVRKQRLKNAGIEEIK